MQEFLPEDLPDMEPSEAMQKLQQVLAEKNFDYVLRCPHCQSFYPNPVPKTAPGGLIPLKCKPSKQWRGQRPPVPEGEKAEWCGKTFRIRVETDLERHQRLTEEKYRAAYKKGPKEPPHE